jgi:outer membrane protein assembly factor BamB
MQHVSFIRDEPGNVGVLSDSPSTPALGSNGTVYVGSYGKKIYAITGDVLNSSPVIGPNGLLCIGSSFPGNKIYAFATRSNGPAKSLWPMRGQTPNTPRARRK